MEKTAPDNPYAPPQARVQDITAGDGGHALAGRGTRLAAVIIDSVLINIAFLAIWIVVLDQRWLVQDAPLSLRLEMIALSFALFVTMNGYLLISRGQTIGKRLLRIRITRRDGSRAGVARLLGLRYALAWLGSLLPLLYLVWNLVDALMIFRDDRRCLHDMIADTIVVKA